MDFDNMQKFIDFMALLVKSEKEEKRLSIYLPSVKEQIPFDKSPREFFYFIFNHPENGVVEISDKKFEFALIKTWRPFYQMFDRLNN